MSTQLSSNPSDVQLLHQYLGHALTCDNQGLTLDEALLGFAEYYRQLRDVRGKVQAAEGSLARGEGKPLDVEGLIRRVRERLATQGIVD
jgi:hypothetical protein